MHETIDSSDLKTIEVPLTMDTDFYITEASELIGKTTRIPLNENKGIPKNALLSEEELENTVYVTINTKYVKTGGAKPGDIVDVYKVNIQEGEWNEDRIGYLIVEDALVINLTDKNGNTTQSSSKIPLNTNSPIEVVKLAIKPEQAQFLVPASVINENGYVLVVKNSILKDIANKINSESSAEVDEFLENTLEDNTEIEEAEETEETEELEVISNSDSTEQ